MNANTINQSYMAQGHLKKIIIYGTSCVIKENYKKNIIFFNTI
jgi:hypothetical protein